MISWYYAISYISVFSGSLVISIKQKDKYSLKFDILLICFNGLGLSFMFYDNEKTLNFGMK
jgi:hypothetical protein